MINLEKVYCADYALKNVIRKTDLIFAPNIVKNENIFLKTENLQVTGSFKVRGAFHKVNKLSQEERQKGIIACSAGNHAQGVALAAQKLGIKAVICMPEGAPISKVEATKSYGAEVVLKGETYDDCYNYALELQKEKEYTFIHPFDDEDVIAGQGTIGLEILEQLKDVDNVVVPIGGGGLISGIAYVIKTLKPTCKVYGIQAEKADAMYESYLSGERIETKTSSTFADGIAVKKPGINTFEIIKKYVDEVITVTDDEIATAILTLMEKQKLVCEGAGAVSVAACMFGKIDLKNKNTVCVLSGGNIDVNILSKVITRGLLKTGRTDNLTIFLTDKPGQLVGVSEIIARCGGNVTQVFHDQGEENSEINSCILRVKVETRDHEQIKLIRDSLREGGFNLVSNNTEVLLKMKNR